MGETLSDVTDRVAVAAALDHTGASHASRTPTGTRHAFTNETRPEVHAPAATEQAWGRTLDFFRRHLR